MSVSPVLENPNLETYEALDLESMDAACLPHVPALRQVVSGERFRTAIHYGEAKLQFFHGCLLGRVYYQDRCYAFPPIFKTTDGALTWRLFSDSDKFSQHEFLTLPTDILLVFFNLLKLTFQNERIHCPTRHPFMTQLMTEIGWV